MRVLLAVFVLAAMWFLVKPTVDGFDHNPNTTTTLTTPNVQEAGR